MKIHGPRFILISGLALAIGLGGSLVAAAGKPAKKPVRVAQGIPDLNSTPVPAAPVPAAPAPADPNLAAPNSVPDWTPTPLSPIPDPATSSSPAIPVPQDPAATTPAPISPGTRPNPSAADRPPLGLHYGEQEHLEMLKNPNYRRRFLASPGNPPPAALPTTSDEVLLTPTPAGADRWGLTPPPGTLGQTYKRRSRAIEDTKHPRVGAVEVHLPEEVDVTGQGLKTKWNGKVWRLESEPLLPGIPHIYEIKASWGEGTEPQIRTVRLIMGRIIDLDF